MSLRLELVALLVTLLSVGLVACGGGSGAEGGSGEASSPTTNSTTATNPDQAGGVTFSKPKHSSAPPALRRAAARARVRAGDAAAYVHVGVDNSVPTFGTESSAADRAAATATISAYLRARRAGAWGNACRYLAADMAAGFSRLGKAGKGCPEVLATLATDRSDPLRGPIDSLRVKGANAFALFTGPEGQQYIVPMLREAGAWRLTQAGPITYPPAFGGGA